ncbi:MAG: hypothetical protein NWE93_06365 [Candidatus Bathyarchaeota archaeon]|nr:hypothetical protein [Candidatus Bathyarchaeota archaeon]
MRDIEKNIKTLAGLGVSTTQSKVYLSLVERGTSTIRVISNCSGVGRPDTYRAMLELKQMGLIETVLATPTMYKPVPLTEAVSILLENKQKEIKHIRENAQKMLDAYKKNPRNMENICDSEFILTPKGATAARNRQKAIAESQQSIDCIMSFKKFNQMLLRIGGEIAKAANRGVKVRLILEKTHEAYISKNFLEFSKKAVCQIRFTQREPPCFIIIFDAKEIQIMTSPGDDLIQSSILRSNNMALVGTLQDHFENLWSRYSEPWAIVEQQTKESPRTVDIG